jgi:hypothetical protein
LKRGVGWVFSSSYISILSVTIAFALALALVFVCFLDLSQQISPKKPSVVQEVDVAVSVGVVVFIFVFVGGSSPSKHPPNQPGYLHEDVVVGDEVVVVIVGAGAGEVVCDVLVSSSSSPSLQPNQPGVLQVDVDDVVLALVVVFVPVVVVDSSRQPHHPGVLHVSVLVRVLILVEVAVCLRDVVVVSLPLLSKYCQV